MKITKAQLKQIIKEELEVILTNEEAADLFGDEILEQLEEEALEESEGKNCADSPKGCIRKRGDSWVILNNKKGGVWRKCDSRSHCEEILDAFHASKG